MATAGLIASAATAASAHPRPPIENSSISSTGIGGDGGAGLGPAKPWLGSLGGINTATGNMFTAIPLFGWQAKGGMSVGFSLSHNSLTDPNDTAPHFVPKWSFSYNTYMTELANGDLRLCEEDGNVSTFKSKGLGVYENPPGMYLTTTIYRQPNNGKTYTLKTSTGTTLFFQDAVGGRVYLNTITDRNTYHIDITRDSTNPYQVTRVTEANTGRYLSVEWVSGKINAVYAPNGQRWGVNCYNSAISEIVWPDNANQSPRSCYLHFDYTALDNIAVLRDRRGNFSYFSYEDNENHSAITKVTDPSGNFVTLDYDQSSGRVIITDANQHTTKHFYGSGRLQSVQDANGQSVFFDEYDSNNNPKKITDRRNNVTRMTYDGYGNVLSVEVPIAGTQTVTSSSTYNQFNEPLVVTDALNKPTTYQYDAQGNLLYVTDPLNHQTQFTVVGGLVTEIIDPLNHKSTIGYDADGNVTLMRDANGVETRAEYDVMGAKKTEWDTLNRPTYFTLDEWERVIAVRKPGGTNAPDWAVIFGLDPNGNTVWVHQPDADPSHPVYSNFTYDASNRLTFATNGRQETSQNSYDGPGQKGLLSWSQNGNGASSRHTYLYNERSLVSQITHPDGDTEQFAYDNNDNLSAHKNGDDIVNSYVYDKRNLLTDVLHPPGYGTQISAPIHFERDALGRTAYMTDYVGRTDFTFDDAGRMTRLGSPRGVMLYDYDAADRLTTKTMQGLGSWQYTYDAGNRVYALLNPFNESTSFHYDAASRTDYTISGNNIYTFYNYDNQSRLRDINHQRVGSPAPFNSHRYEYDGAGRLTLAVQDGLQTRYGYDDADQLTRELRIEASGTVRYDCTYAYDNNGNRMSKSQNGAVLESYTYTPGDRIKTADGPYGHKDYFHNRNGFLYGVNLNGARQATINSDLEGRVLSYVDKFGAVTSFQYNGLGQRVFKQDYTGQYNYVADGATPGSPIVTDTKAVYTGTLSEYRNGVSSFYHTDLIGTLGTLTNAGQSQTDGALFDVWGIATDRYGPNPTPFVWGAKGGYQKDATTELVLMGNRYYDPTIGRFISRDPARSGSNWYAYADNNPTTNLDPLGLQTNGDGPSSAGGIINSNGNVNRQGLGTVTNFEIDFVKELNGAWNSFKNAIGIGGHHHSNTQPPPRHSFATANKNAGVFLGDFLFGSGETNRYYGPDSAEAYAMMNSSSVAYIRHTMALRGNRTTPSVSGPPNGIGTYTAALFTALDPLNGTQFQMGAYNWRATREGNQLHFRITNSADVNSFMYHATGAGANLEHPSAPMRTIHQTIEWWESIR